jgi:hypothetical protein
VSADRGKCMVSDLETHNASVRIENAQALVDAEGYSEAIDVGPYLDDPRWPTSCLCGYVFVDSDERQIFQDRIYQRSDTGQAIPLRDAPPGAMWNAWWMASVRHGEDGRCLIVKLPTNHEWVIDGQASNCTMPDDHSQKLHHCWIRHGDPTKPETVTVDKNGTTCGAGAGSIQSGDYHGFLQNGVLT